MKLIAENIGYERNFQNLFANVNFELKKKECIIIRGANGCGKSTLLRILAGLIRPITGNIFWNDKSIIEDKDYQHEIHYLGHQNGVKPYLTVEENIHLNSTLAGFKILNIDTLLQTLNLLSVRNKKSQYLSAGQLRRLAFAKIMAFPRKLWILDEPTTALDTEGQRLFDDMLQSHLSHDGMAIITSHMNEISDTHKTLILGDNNV